MYSFSSEDLLTHVRLLMITPGICSTRSARSSTRSTLPPATASVCAWLSWATSTASGIASALANASSRRRSRKTPHRSIGVKVSALSSASSMTSACKEYLEALNCVLHTFPHHRQNEYWKNVSFHEIWNFNCYISALALFLFAGSSQLHEAHDETHDDLVYDLASGNCGRLALGDHPSHRAHNVGLVCCSDFS